MGARVDVGSHLEPMVIETYGFHQDADLVFLHEHQSSRCLTPGLEALPSPFTLLRTDKTLCPHNLYPPKVGMIIDHPLVEVMAPTPAKAGAYYVPSQHCQTVRSMTLMIGGPQIRVFVPWAVKADRILPQLTITNAAPMVITNYEPKDYTLMERLASLPRTRNVVFCGPYKVTGTETLPTFDYQDRVDWAEIGAAMTERYVRECLN